MHHRLLVVLPYLVAGLHAVTVAQNWTWQRLGSGDGPRLVGPEIDGWDYALDLAFAATFRIDVSTLLEDTGLGEDSQIEFVTTVETGRRLQRSCVFTESVSLLEATAHIGAHFQLTGNQLAKDLDIISGLYLVSPGTSTSLPHAKKSGSRLWQHRLSTKLEGQSNRPTIRAVSFSEQLHHLNADHARYVIDVNDTAELEDDLSASVTIFLNLDVGDFVQRVEHSDRLALEELAHALVRTVCARVANKFDRARAGTSSWAPGSIGHIASNWFSSLEENWNPSRSLEAVSNWSRFEARVQDRIRL